MNFFIISDYLSDEVLGGCEINNTELAIELRKLGHQVLEKKSAFTEPDFIIKNDQLWYIISNFIDLSDSSKEEIKKCKYVIYEHDHKYLRSRNPAQYEDYKAPQSELINVDFYRRAQAVFCQSDFHMSIVKRNTGLDNLISLSGNLWSEASLNIMEEVSKQEKEPRASILNSPIPHKNTFDAIKYCQYKNKNYDLVSSNNYHAFLRLLGKNEEFIFFPQTPETLSRVVCEARMMNMSVTANERVGATKEPWFSLKGDALISRMRDHRKTIATKVEKAFRKGDESAL